jgi:hypothetical protein
VVAPDVYGSSSQSINWDFALFTPTDAANFVPEHSSLSLSSSTTLTDSLTSSPDLSLNYATSWNTFPLPSSGPEHYLGNDSQLLAGGLIPFTTSGDALNTMAMSANMGDLHDSHFSTPMVKGNILALSYYYKY